MRLLKGLALSTAALCAAVFLFAVLSLPPRAERLHEPSRAPGARATVAGVFHVHTTRSDGTGTVQQVAEAARRAGLSFVVFTDHGDGTRIPDPPAYHSGVLCIDGVEISTVSGHYAAIGMRPSPYPLAGEARDVVEDVGRLGGFGIAAHPDSPKAALRWRDWATPFDGLEWLNADSEWRDEPGTGLARVLLAYPFRGPEALASMFSRPNGALAHWDALTRQRRVVALAAADAHARLGWRSGGDPYQNRSAVDAPSYETVFRTFAIHLQLERPLVGRASADALTVRSALASGHLYSSIDALAAPADLEFSAQSGPYAAHAGDDLTLGGPVEIQAAVNAPNATIVLLENGREVAQNRGRLSYRAAEKPAVFRVEVQWPSAPGRPAVPWIVSNAIYVGGFVSPRQERVRPEARAVVPVSTVEGGWAAEHEPRSQAGAVTEGDAVATLAYTLASGARGNQFAALTHAVRGLAAFDRLQFRARADRPMRLSVQCRVMFKDHDERWQRSVYLDQEPRDITVFLDDLRPIGPTTSWSPDLAKVSTLLFVVDAVNTRPGSAGAVRVEDVRFASADVRR